MTRTRLCVYILHTYLRQNVIQRRLIFVGPQCGRCHFSGA